MTGYCDDSQATSHQSRHYESCQNSTCSRSPSPIHRQLWEPKHAPQKLKTGQKASSKLCRDTSKQSSTNGTRSREKSPFLAHWPDLNGASPPSRGQDPLFTYTINEGSFDRENHTKQLEVKIQRHLDSSRPSLGSKTPETFRSSNHSSRPAVKNEEAATNLNLELELDTSHVAPIVTIKKSPASLNAQQTVHVTTSRPPTPCTKSFPYPYSCCTNPPSCFPQQALDLTTGLCDFTCQACPCSYLSSPRSNLKEDKATSPTKPFSIQTDEVEPCIPACQVCPGIFPCLSSSPTKEDKAVSPISPHSRSVSPSPPRNGSPNSKGRRRQGSDISSEGTIEIQFDESSKVHVNWEGDVGPIEVDLPTKTLQYQSNQSDDRVHSYDPQLEVFYISSGNQSGSPTPCKYRIVSPCSSFSERHDGSRPVTPCSQRHPNQYENCSSFNEVQLEFSCPSRSLCSPSTSYARCPDSKPSIQKALSRKNSSGSIEIYNEDGEIITNIDWSTPISVVNSHKPFSGRLNRRTQRQKLGTPKRPLSPVLTVTPPTAANGQMTIELSPKSTGYRRCEETCSLGLNTETPAVRGEDLLPRLSRYCHHRVGVEEGESHPQKQQGASPIADIGDRAFMQSEDLTCISSCNQPCTLTPCFPPCDSYQRRCAISDSCCCCQNKDCITEPIKGINRCPSLPPHLQSDWSANLRYSSGESLRTKPILYRDTVGHEHIMFADGSIEHLSHRCEPATSTQPQPSPQPSSEPPPPTFAMPCRSPPVSLPSSCHHPFKCEEGRFDWYSCADSFCPQSGDIVIRARQRLPCMYPGKDNGQVAFFTSDYLDLQEGDSIVRLGNFDNFGEWCSSKVVEMYLRGSHGRWMFLGNTEANSVTLYPLKANQHQVVRTPNKQLNLRQGDLVISTIPRPNSFYFWNPKRKVEVNPSHLLLRAYVGHPQVVDENHNLACCVPGHLPVGYVELYLKVKRVWLFLGRDEHMFTEHELMHFS